MFILRVKSWCLWILRFLGILTKYHMTIQNTMTHTKAKRNVGSDSDPRFEKFTMPWNAAQNKSEWVSFATFPIPHEAKNSRRKKDRRWRWLKSKCHRNHIAVMISTYCHMGKSLSSFCRNPLQPNSSNRPYTNASKHRKPMSKPPMIPKTRHGTAIVRIDFQTDFPQVVYTALRLKMVIATSAPTMGPRPVESWKA